MKTNTMTSGTKARTDTRLTDTLNQVLADSYALMGLTHLAHWNIEGPRFFELHKAFQHQYEELFEAVDEIAERVRALESLALGGLNQLARTAALQEPHGRLSEEDWLKILIDGHTKTIADATAARDLSSDMNDLQSQDLMIKRLASHQKTLWMLKSSLK